MVEHTMDISSWLRKQLEDTSPDLLRAMVKDFAEALISADADAVCGAGYGERSPERVNRRNGYRERDWDTRVGSIELAVPRLREGSYFPDWLLQPRRRAEQAFVSVIADANLDEARTLARSTSLSPPEAAEAVYRLGSASVVVTGGDGDGIDWFCDGNGVRPIEGPLHHGGATHGSGCTHSAALAVYLARGLSRADLEARLDA